MTRFGRTRLFRIPPAGDTDFLIYDEPWNGAAYGVVRAGGAPIRSYANPAAKTYFLEGGNRLDFPDLLDQGPGHSRSASPCRSRRRSPPGVRSRWSDS